MTSVAVNMRDEVNKSPAVVRRQEALLAEPIASLVKRIDACRPRLVMTCARGSSTHAAKFAKHVFERYLGIPVAAAAPNIATQYHRSLDLDGQMFLSISQSGRSDDLIETTLMARRAGALTVSLVNDPASPLARASELVLPLCAGPELSVAATKSFVASLAALMRIVAAWSEDPLLREACVGLPDRLAAASLLDWSAALGPLAQADSVATIGRGPTFAIAYEAALKLKETCELHAEAFSAAEFRHGPIALVSAAYPVLLFHPRDEAGSGFSGLAGDLQRIGGCVLVAGDAANGIKSIAGASATAAGSRCRLSHSVVLWPAGDVGRMPGQGCRSAAPSSEGDPHPMSDITHAVTARTLFDGVNVRTDAAVLIRGEQIVGICGRDEVSSSVPVQELPDTVWLAPGFIDVQVNGGGDVLFNDAPTSETIQAIAQAHRRFGTTALLPTLISDSPDKMAQGAGSGGGGRGREPVDPRHPSGRTVSVT